MLNVAKHETQTWHAYIQPETMNLTSNQTTNPKANRPRIRGLLQSSPSTRNAETHCGNPQTPKVPDWRILVPNPDISG
jgi:hypothetical protein